jgi:hypothetical protein
MGHGAALAVGGAPEGGMSQMFKIAMALLAGNWRLLSTCHLLA